MANKYEYEAARIEQVFAAHKITVRIWEVTITPQCARYMLTTPMDVPIGRVLRLDADIAYSLGKPRVRVTRDQGLIAVEVPRPGAKPITLRSIMAKIPPPPPHCGLLGIADDSAPLLLRLDSPDVAHVLVAGATGSGKTVLLRSFVLSLALWNTPEQLRIVLLDPKERGLAPLTELSHCIGLFADPPEVSRQLLSLVALMEHRQSPEPRIIVVVDELAELLMTGDRHIQRSLVRLTQRGREVGMHVIAATQRPSADLVGGLMKANFPVRLIGSVTSADDARVAAGRSKTMAENLNGRGDFVMVARGEEVRFQAAWSTDEEIAALITDNGVTRAKSSPLPAVPMAVPEAKRAILPVSSGTPLLALPVPVPDGPADDTLQRTIWQTWLATGRNLSETCRRVFGYDGGAAHRCASPIIKEQLRRRGAPARLRLVKGETP